MQLLYILFGFILGVAFTLFMFSSQIWDGQKVGYGDGDISPEKGCCRSVPPAQYKPDIRPPKQ